MVLLKGSPAAEAADREEVQDREMAGRAGTQPRKWGNSHAAEGVGRHLHPADKA